MRSSESLQKCLFIQAELEGLLAVDKDDRNFFAELLERLVVLHDVDLAPPERMGLLQSPQLGLHLVAQTAVGFGVNHDFIHDLNVAFYGSSGARSRNAPVFKCEKPEVRSETSF